MAAESVAVPKVIRNRPILRKKIWERCHLHNEHFMGAVVGREGSGKSYTALRIGELCDPDFGVDKVFWEPIDFLKRLRDDAADGRTKGSVYVLDESGVGVGSRTWYDKAQIIFNQVLQVIRDENAAVLFTLPGMSELDSQAENRLIGIFEMVEKDEDEQVATAKYKNVVPDRVGHHGGNTIMPFPEMRVGGRTGQIKYIGFKPPSASIIEPYEEQKTDFQDKLYDEAIRELEGDEAESEELTPKEIFRQILDDGGAEQYLKEANNGREFIDADLISFDYEISDAKATKVKKALVRELGRGEG